MNISSFASQDYQSFDIRVATDLSAVKSCEILEDKREPDYFQTRIVGFGGILFKMKVIMKRIDFITKIII